MISSLCSSFQAYVFNPNTLKVSYTCMRPNMAAVIRQHNSTIINSQPPAPDNAGSVSKCNCRVKANCPMNGECLVQGCLQGHCPFSGHRERLHWPHRFDVQAALQLTSGEGSSCQRRDDLASDEAAVIGR